MSRTQEARAAFLSRFDAEVDPESVLPPAERERRAKLARSVYFAELRSRRREAQSGKLSDKDRANLTSAYQQLGRVLERIGQLHGDAQGQPASEAADAVA